MQFFGALPTTFDVYDVATFLWTGGVGVILKISCAHTHTHSQTHTYVYYICLVDCKSCRWLDISIRPPEVIMNDWINGSREKWVVLFINVGEEI